MSDTTEYDEMKTKVDQAKSDKDKAQGSLDNLMERLKTECGCSTIKEAKKLLDSLEKEEKKAREEFEDASDEFDKKWREYESSKDSDGS